MSIGLASLRPGQSTADSLRGEADAALYEAKRRGGDQVVHYEEIRETVAVTTADEKAAVRRMLDERGLDVHFQPIWNLTTCELIGVEALARPHATYGLEGPQEAFDIAEQLGRTHELDELCASTAFAQADRLPSGVALFVNVCPQTLDLDADENDWFLADVERRRPCPRAGRRRGDRALRRAGRVGRQVPAADEGAGIQDRARRCRHRQFRPRDAQGRGRRLPEARPRDRHCVGNGAARPARSCSRWPPSPIGPAPS